MVEALVTQLVLYAHHSICVGIWINSRFNMPESFFELEQRRRNKHVFSLIVNKMFIQQFSFTGLSCNCKYVYSPRPWRAQSPFKSPLRNPNNFTLEINSIRQLPETLPLKFWKNFITILNFGIRDLFHFILPHYALESTAEQKSLRLLLPSFSSTKVISLKKEDKKSLLTMRTMPSSFPIFHGGEKCSENFLSI